MGSSNGQLSYGDDTLEIKNRKLIESIEALTEQSGVAEIHLQIMFLDGSMIRWGGQSND